ncbi:MAG: GNAT family N-acetyltransferase [Clostridium sulfidigenes]|uniref:GNAT family N-acetyltransferase n=1 Tax=Clostridium sulfidigenes TaxID=318464 RepID=A0A927W176_9CLOT|nr:GNAT family N-acetyltransferase [Clostridium sulfidigenes]HCO73234.1 GNAT family N-acetyltransferase [Clostridium sp.]
MKFHFKRFNNTYYDRVCDFLIEISKCNRTHINWNWARWEWMFFHPEFNRDLIDKIGLWFLGEELIGLTTYDHYLGEGFFATKKGFEELEKDILEYTIANFSDENGLGIAVNDTDNRTLNLLKDYGFLRNEQTENMLELTLDEANFDLKSIEGISLESINIEKDLYKHHELLWKGFNHEGQAPLDEDIISKQKIMLSAPHLNPLLHVIAKTECGEYIAYSGLWYNEETDYVYVEPVCTIPEYRNNGIARVLLMEALKRAYDLGAKKAYVISDSNFYKAIGFKQHSHYTFYWYNN